jgi:hypothetical protein
MTNSRPWLVNPDVEAGRELGEDREGTEEVAAGNRTTPMRGEWVTLKRGADVVGEIRIEACDNFYIAGRFRAGPEFERYAELLEKAYRRWLHEAEDWLDALEEVNDLGLRLEDLPNGKVTEIRDFQLQGFTRVKEEEGESVEFKFVHA